MMTPTMHVHPRNPEYQQTLCTLLSHVMQGYVLCQELESHRDDTIIDPHSMTEHIEFRVIPEVKENSETSDSLDLPLSGLANPTEGRTHMRVLEMLSMACFGDFKSQEESPTLDLVPRHVRYCTALSTLEGSRQHHLVVPVSRFVHVSGAIVEIHSSGNLGRYLGNVVHVRC